MSDTPLLAQHQIYLLHSILNFFMGQGKVAMVVFEGADTQERFEATLKQQVRAQLDCEIIQLQPCVDEDLLATFNFLLSQISMQQAIQVDSTHQANFLLWVSENEDLTPECFNRLKNIILQLSGLQLKLYVSVTSNRWSNRLFDITGQKIGYWFIPSHESLKPTETVVPDTFEINSDQIVSPLANQMTLAPPFQPRRIFNLKVCATVLLVLLAIATYYVTHTAQKKTRLLKKDTSSIALQPGDTDWVLSSQINPLALTGPDVTAPAQEQLRAPLLAQAESGASAEITPNQTQSIAVVSSVQPIATPMEIKTPAPKSDSAPQFTDIKTLDDCPKGNTAHSGTSTMPTAKPVSFVKDTNYIHVKSKLSRKVCVAPAGGSYRILNLQANQGNSAFGKGPWRVYSPNLLQIELYFQGARVKLGPNIVDTVEVIAR